MDKVAMIDDIEVRYTYRPDYRFVSERVYIEEIILGGLVLDRDDMPDDMVNHYENRVLYLLNTVTDKDKDKDKTQGKDNGKEN